MTLTKAQIKWMEHVSNIEIVGQTQSSAQAREWQRNKALSAGQQALAEIRDEIAAAQSITLTKLSKTRPDGGAWKAAADQTLPPPKVYEDGAEDQRNLVRYEIPWHAARSGAPDPVLGKWVEQVDLEVDTRADIGPENEEVSPDSIAKLREMYGRIIEVQDWMKSRFDAEGQPLFNDDDIRREVWTPLVRSGVIPENLVQDKYSEHAIAFAGAAEFYTTKIEDYSKTTTRTQELRKEYLGGFKDVVSLAGALTGGALTAQNALVIAENNKEIRNTLAQTQELSEQRDNPALSSAEREAAQQKLVAEQARLGTLFHENGELQAQSNYAQDATAILLGAIGTYEAVKEHQESDKELRAKWAETANRALNIAQTSAAAIARTTLSAQAQGQGDNPRSVNSSANIDHVVNGINAAFDGAKIGMGMALVLSEKDSKKREALLEGIVLNLATAIEHGIISHGKGQVARSDPGSDAQTKARQQTPEYELIARQVKASIVSAFSAKAALQEIMKPGGKPTKVAYHLVSGGLAAGLAAGVTPIFADVRESVDNAERANRPVHEQPYLTSDNPVAGARAQAEGAAASLDGVLKALDAADKAVGAAAASSSPADAPSKVQDALVAEITAQQRKHARAELAKAFSADGVQAIVAEADSKLAEYDTLYSAAFPDPDVQNRPTADIAAARKAIDEATARTADLRMKAALVEGLTGAGSQLLASLVPGVGAVMATQRLVADLYTLYRQTQSHNAWVESMELAFVGQSAVAPAIANTLANCKVDLDVSRIKVLLDGIGCGAEVGKVFDPTGATTVVSASASMLHTLTNTCYKWYSERQMRLGWEAYKAALDDRGNRKKARQALRLNSTLAKCCVAYGATIMGDPIAKRAVAATGLSPDTLRNDKDICVRVITYLETSLSDHPTVLKFTAPKKKWHPGRPELTLKSWIAFKAAAHLSADPKLDERSLQTPGVDRCLLELAKLKRWNDPKYVQAQKLAQSAADRTIKAEIATYKAIVAELNQAADLLTRLDAGLRSYAPRIENATAEHTEMQQIAGALAHMAELGAVDARRSLDSLVKPHASTGPDQPGQGDNPTHPGADEKVDQAQHMLKSQAAAGPSSADIKHGHAAREAAAVPQANFGLPDSFDKLGASDQKLAEGVFNLVKKGLKKESDLGARDKILLALCFAKERATAREVEPDGADTKARMAGREAK